MDVLEAIGWRYEEVRLLKEGCGLGGEGGGGTRTRPRLGERIAFWSNQMGERGTEVAFRGSHSARLPTKYTDQSPLTAWHCVSLRSHYLITLITPRDCLG